MTPEERLLADMEIAEPIVIVEYDPSWPAVFEALRARISVALGERACAIEHVGSTAVPGLAAKPVIDLDVVVCRADTLDVISALEKIGYRHKGNLGIEDREAFRWSPGIPCHHLYVCAENSAALSNHLYFRDYLRANPKTAREYGQLKTELALQYQNDRAAYTEAKSAFIESILSSATNKDRSGE